MKIMSYCCYIAFLQSKKFMMKVSFHFITMEPKSLAPDTSWHS